MQQTRRKTYCLLGDANLIAHNKLTLNRRAKVGMYLVGALRGAVLFDPKTSKVDDLYALRVSWVSPPKRQN